MRKLRKILLMILCGILMLTGCSESAKKAQNENSSGSNVASEDSSKKEKVEIQFWYGLGSVAGQTMESIIADFNASQDKVKVVGVQQADYNETYQKVQAAIAAKQPPAVFIGSKISEMAESQIAVDLSTFMNDKTPESDYLDVTTEDQYENDKMVNAAMKPYEDIRFLIQKHGDNPMGGRQEAVWNFSRKAKDTRNRLVNRKPYDGVDYTKDMDHFKKYGPWQYWMIIGPTTDYTVFKKSGEQVTINGAALRLSKSGETAPATIEREITEYMQKNNYPVPSPSSTMKYLAHVKSVEVAKAFYDGSIDPKNTRTLVNIDDYVEPRTKGTYIPDDNKKEDKKDDKKTKNEQNNKEENKESNKENKQENNDKPTTNNNPKNETKSTPISAKTELGMREMPMSSGEAIIVETMAESESDNVKQDPRRYRVYTTGNNGHDTYQDSVGITRFRREFTVIQPLHTENASSVVDQALSNYDIFRSLITKESEMGAASFSFKDKEGNWYEVSTIVAGNIHGLLPMDIEHGINDYLTNIDSMKREKQLQDNDKDKKEENDKKALEELKKKNNKNS